MLKEFKEFAVKGNAIDLAIAVVVGAAFTGIVNSLVTDIITPPLSLLTRNANFADLFVNFSGGSFATLEEAKAAGAITLNYGNFLNVLINFVIVSFTIFMVVRQINRFRRQPEKSIPNTKECAFCLTNIPVGASRCPACTSQLAETK